MSDLNIPPEAVEAVAAHLYALEELDYHLVPWADTSDLTKDIYRDHATAAIRAALTAWPGNVHYRGGWEPIVHNSRKPHIILPLTQEPREQWPEGFFKIERSIMDRCATDGCGQVPSIRMEREGVGSVYCTPCARKIAALTQEPRDE